MKFMIGSKPVMLPLLVLSVLLAGCKEYQTPETDKSDLWPAVSGDKFGYINKKGAFVIPPLYDGASSFSCGYALVEQNNRLFFINKKGDIQSTPSFDEADYFYYNYAVVEMDDRKGLFDKKFHYAIQPEYADLERMTADGLVAAEFSDGKWGYVDAAGRVKIQPVYDEASDFEDGVACVCIDSAWRLIDKHGNCVVNAVCADMYSVGDERIVYEQDGRLGLIDTKGHIKMRPVYVEIGRFFDNGLAPVCNGTHWGYINRKGEVALPLSCDGASVFSEGYAFVVQNGKIRLIDTKGRVKHTFDTNEIPLTPLHNGLFLVMTMDGQQYTYSYRTIGGTVVYAWTADAPVLGVKSVLTEDSSDLDKTLRKRVRPTKNYSLTKRY